VKFFFGNIITKKSDNRLAWIDYARGIAILLVVYRHVFEGIKRSGAQVQDFMFLENANIIFYSFRMPLFFILSGVFITASLAKRTLPSFISNKAKVILYPYFLWGAIQIALQLIMAGYVNADRKISDFLYLFYLPREVEQFWYLYTLFNVTILYAFLKVKMRFPVTAQLFLGIILFYSSVLMSQNGFNLGFVSDVFHYYIFFAIGDLIVGQIKKESNIPRFSSWRIFFFLLPFFILSQLYFLVENVKSGLEKYDFIEYNQPLQYILIVIMGCAFVINVCFLFQKYRGMTWLRTVGYYSLYIYVCHVLAASATRIFLQQVLGVHFVPLLLIGGITMAVLLPIIFYNLATSNGWYWLFTLEKPKKSKIPASADPANKINFIASQ
jgi:fucose 4-O-acetylase-like acetyltransferase